MPGGSFCACLPSGPVASTEPGLASSFTLSGIVTGVYPIRLITSPHLAQEFAADLRLKGLAVGEKAFRRRDDRDHPAFAALLKRFIGAIDAQSGARNPLQPAEHFLTVRRELELDTQERTFTVFHDLVIGDKTFRLQDS